MGVLAVCLVAVLAVAALCLLMLQLAGVAGRVAQPPGLRAGWGRVGGLAQWLVLPLVAAGVWGGWLASGALGIDADARRAGLTTAVAIVGVVAGVFTVDTLRRRLGRPYKIVGALLAAVAIALVLSNAIAPWVPRAAATAAVVAGMSLVTLATLHLVFLGAFTLAWDLGTHRPQQQLTEAEAEAVIDWRAGTPRSRPSSRRVRRRAGIVFPGANRPRGPIQKMVSEIFDSDEPPFWKNFLVVRSTPTDVTVTAHLVTGNDDPPPPYEIRITLPTKSSARP